MMMMMLLVLLLLLLLFLPFLLSTLVLKSQPLLLPIHPPAAIILLCAFCLCSPSSDHCNRTECLHGIANSTAPSAGLEEAAAVEAAEGAHEDDEVREVR